MAISSQRVTPTCAHRLLYAAAGSLLFERIAVRGLAQAKDAPGPRLFVALHRNGAIDSIGYLRVAPRAAYVVSAQLHRSMISRAIFPGIALARQKDRARGMEADNHAALAACVDHLCAGGDLFVFPEGTSALGASHLPLRPGAARIAAAVLARGGPLSIVPLAIFYERACAWQSRAEVAVGTVVRFSAGSRASEDALHRVITDGLRAVGVNVDSEQALRDREVLAFAASLDGRTSYGQCLKRLEAALPASLQARLRELRRSSSEQRAWSFQGLPLVAPGAGIRELMQLLGLLPLVLAALVLNLPPLAAAALAGRRLADDRNVITFWRAAVGFPAALIWAIAMLIGLSRLSHGVAFAYAAVSLAGVRAVRAAKLRLVGLYNACCAAPVRVPMAALLRDLAGYLHEA